MSKILVQRVEFAFDTIDQWEAFMYLLSNISDAPTNGEAPPFLEWAVAGKEKWMSRKAAAERFDVTQL